MKVLIAFWLALLPQQLFAGTDCRAVEYPDHYVATCSGDEQGAPAPLQYIAPSPLLSSGDASLKSPGTVPTTSSVTEQPGTSSHLQNSGKLITATVLKSSAEQKEEFQSQLSSLSKRNRAKINVVQMKEQRSCAR